MRIHSIHWKSPVDVDEQLKALNEIRASGGNLGGVKSTYTGSLWDVVWCGNNPLNRLPLTREDLGF